MPLNTGLALNMGGGLNFSRFTIDYSELTAAATTQTIDLFTLKKGSVVLGVRIKHSVAFLGGTIATLTVSVGSSAGTTTTFASAFDVMAAVADTTLQCSANFKCATLASAGETVQATFVSTVDNVTSATQGSVDIDILYASVSTPL
jgi:hypothetical protein